MRKILSVCAYVVSLTMATQPLYAQTHGNNEAVVIQATPPATQHTSLKAVVYLNDVKSNLSPSLFTTEIEHPSMEENKIPEDAILPEVKDNNAQYKKAVETPALFRSIVGYSDNQYTPPDNSIAISNGGYIVSAMNSHFRVYDSNGKIQAVNNFNNLLKQELPALTNTYFDPRVLYDPEEDRFVIVILNGSQSTESYVVMLFSKTNNPLDGWNVFALKGDLLNKNQWLDYPTIGFSKHDLYITGNMFNNNSSFRESVIIQIDKNEGFSGSGNLTYRTWSNLTNESSLPVFTPVPAPSYDAANFGPGMNFLAHDLGGGSRVYHFILNGDVTSTTASMSRNVVAYPFNYLSPGLAAQKGESDLLNTGDTRIKQAFIQNNDIHYVFSARNTQGFSTIIYSRLNIPSKSLTYAIYGASGLSYCYPSIVSMAPMGNTTDKTVLIGYLRAGANLYPELAVVACDPVFDFSELTTIQPGITGVDIIRTESTERWGDYTGMARKYNDNTCIFSGCFGAGSNWQTRIGHTGFTSTRLSSIAESNISEAGLEVFPNPVIDNYSLKFELKKSTQLTVRLMDMQGRMVETLFQGYQAEGDKVFSFNKAGLSQGVYMLMVEAGNKSIASRKIVVK